MQKASGKPNNVIEALWGRAAWYRNLAVEATDPEVASALLQMATEVENAAQAAQENAYRGHTL